MAAIPISGRNGEALTGSCTDARHILETGTGGAPDFDGDGRIFELLHLVARNSSAASQSELHLWDRDEGSQPATTGQIGAAIIIAPNTTLEKTWTRGTGPRFRTNITASTSRTTNRGTVAIRDVFASGLLH
jgi:hypothetical protein